MPIVTRFGAVLAAVSLFGAACTSTSTYTSSVTPDTSPSPSASAISSPSPSPSPTASGPLAITAVPVHNGEIGQGFAPITLAATGGIEPYSWAVGTGALPTGLSLSADGVISGQVTAAGAFKFNVALADSGGHQATKAAAITIYKALAVKGTCAQLCVIGQGCAKCGGFGTVTGGETPYAYQVTGGALPKGMSLSGLALKGGFPAGAYSLVVQVGDKLGAKATVNAKWSIYSPATLSSGGDCIDDPGNTNPPSCTIRWTYSGGNPTVAPKLVINSYAQNCNAATQCATPSAPPAVWKVSVQAGVITIQAAPIACTSSTSVYIGTIDLALVDPSTCPTTSQSNQVPLKVDLSYSC